MYLDMSEQARLINSISEMKENELYGLWCPAPVFASPGIIIPPSIDRFLALNAKLCLHSREAPDDDTLLEQWSQLEHTVIWKFFFRNEKNKNKKDYIPALHVHSDAMYPDSIPQSIQQGLDAGFRELLSQAASSRAIEADRLNPRVAAVKRFLKENRLVVKPTDKNLGLSVFHADE